MENECEQHSEHKPTIVEIFGIHEIASEMLKHQLKLAGKFAKMIEAVDSAILLNIAFPCGERLSKIHAAHRRLADLVESNVNNRTSID